MRSTASINASFCAGVVWLAIVGRLVRQHICFTAFSPGNVRCANQTLIPHFLLKNINKLDDYCQFHFGGDRRGGLGRLGDGTQTLHGCIPLFFPIWRFTHPPQFELDGYLPWSDTSIIGEMKPVRNSSRKHSRAWKSLRMSSHILAAIAGRVMDFMCAIAVYPHMPLPKIATPGAAKPTTRSDIAQSQRTLLNDRKGIPSLSQKSLSRNQTFLEVSALPMTSNMAASTAITWPIVTSAAFAGFLLIVRTCFILFLLLTAVRLTRLPTSPPRQPELLALRRATLIISSSISCVPV